MRLSAQHLLEAVKWLAIFSLQLLGVCTEEEGRKGGKEGGGRREGRTERRKTKGKGNRQRKESFHRH